MKHALFITIVIMLSACAPENKPGSQVEAVSCKLHTVFPVQATYPDGVSRKSSVYACSNGCGEYRYVNDESVRFNTCEFTPGVVQP